MSKVLAMTVIGAILASSSFINPFDIWRRRWEPPTPPIDPIEDLHGTNLPFEYCDDSKQDVKAGKVVLNAPAESGKPLKLTITGQAVSQFTTSYTYFFLTKDGAKLFEDNKDIINKYSPGNNFVSNQNCDLPYFIPEGSYVATYTLNSGQIVNLCIRFNLDIKMSNN